MKEVGDQGERLNMCELDSIDLGFCPLAEFLLAKSTGSFTIRRSVSIIQAVIENVCIIEQNLPRIKIYE